MALSHYSTEILYVIEYVPSSPIVQVIEKTPVISDEVPYTCDENQIIMSMTDSNVTHECVVCLEGKPLNEFEAIYSDACQHVERTVCNSCVYEHTKHLGEDWSMFDEQVPCPEPQCSAKFDFHAIRQILLLTGKDHQVFEQYDDHLIYCRLEQMTEFVWCAHECGSGQLHDVEGSSNPAVTCIKCKQRTCFKHRTMWHEDMSCDEYDVKTGKLSGTDATNNWLTLHSKKCSHCGWHIEKNEGCDHMTCRQCKHEFCWECLVDYKLITSKGQSQHLITCSHYQVAFFVPHSTATGNKYALFLSARSCCCCRASSRRSAATSSTPLVCSTMKQELEAFFTMFLISFFCAKNVG